MATATRMHEMVLTGWGLRNRSRSRVVMPKNIDEIATIFREAREAGSTVALRGAGCSYGDAAGNDGAVVIDTREMDHIRGWDAARGVVIVEPGVTIAQLWRRILPDGWWPAVVPGTSAVTVGGAAAANIHGKNNWHAGSFGDSVIACDLLLPSGAVVTCSRDEYADHFHAAIGSMGLLGCFVSLTLQARRIHSGLVAESQRAYGSLDALLAGLDEATYWATDLVAWVDTSAKGRHLGRGLLKAGRDLLPGEDPYPERTLNVAAQRGGAGVARMLPAGMIPRLARPMTTRPGVSTANRAQWLRGQGKRARAFHLETYARANFLLDAIPNWRETYLPGGLIQHQSFVPKEKASAAFKDLLARCQRAGIVPSLAVLKKHKPSDFLLSYFMDGYSLALDFPVRRGNEARTLALMRELNDALADAGGRVYFAKDATATAEQVSRMYGAATLDQFAAIKRQCDPDGLLSTDQWRRIGSTS